MNCKLCALLPNEALQQDLLSHSSRWIAAHYDVGRTTVNKHRKACMNITMPGSVDYNMEKQEFQSVEWAGDSGVFKTGDTAQVLESKSFEDILEMFGHDPEQVSIKDVIWERHTQGADGTWKHRYSFAIVRNTKVSNLDIDPVKILNELSIKSPILAEKNTHKAESTFVLDWADWQYAKMEGGGTDGLLRRVYEAYDLALERIVELRLNGRGLQKLVIIGGGDMIEGCVIYPNQSYEIDGNRREQIRGTVALILAGIEILAPLFEEVRIVVAPGNHGEHRIGGNRTTIGDNDDLLVFEMAELACANDPRFKHVSFEIAEREISIATKIYDWTYGITHGDVFGKGSGTGVRNKVFNWFKTMAANRHPVGQADVLVTHHFHHDALEDWGNTLWVQNPTMDGGSHYFTEFSGHDTKPGMNSWVVTPSERFQDKQVLRPALKNTQSSSLTTTAKNTK